MDLVEYTMRVISQFFRPIDIEANSVVYVATFIDGSRIIFIIMNGEPVWHYSELVGELLRTHWGSQPDPPEQWAELFGRLARIYSPKIDFSVEK